MTEDFRKSTKPPDEPREDQSQSAPEFDTVVIEDLDAAPEADEIHGGKCPCLSDDPVWGTKPH